MTCSDVALPLRTDRDVTPGVRTSRIRTYVMTPPDHFAVRYAINPWMDASAVADPRVAARQWANLRRTYEELGHTVQLVEPVAGQPDMVFAANGGTLVRGKAIVARFAYAQRAAESAAYAEWMTRQGYAPVHTHHVNEGQGDLLVVGDIMLAGHGFRTDRRAHAEIEAIAGLPVISLELVDPRFYHLDTALAVLDDRTVAYYPPAFSAESRAVLRRLYPDAILVAKADADVLGLNAVSDGRHVVLPAAAMGFAEQLRTAGYTPVGVDLSELLKSGGSVKCCTLEVHP